MRGKCGEALLASFSFFLSLRFTLLALPFVNRPPLRSGLLVIVTQTFLKLILGRSLRDERRPRKKVEGVVGIEPDDSTCRQPDRGKFELGGTHVYILHSLEMDCPTYHGILTKKNNNIGSSLVRSPRDRLIL